ncbi:SRPBCC family protein [Nocardia sp. NPDC059228]|uniref:SRPBCC family protein n=1 Tax=Nocardia sp. NPDC059228 TaxID=3346777 RepID=UPI0036BD45EB
MMANRATAPASWDGHSWIEAERAAEKLVYRVPTLAVEICKALLPARRAASTGDTTVTATQEVVIDAPVARIYARVSDVTQMGQWSPENTGAAVRGRGPVGVGTVFYGHNRRGRLRWTTRCEVITADENECFAFKVKALGWGRYLVPLRIATWSFQFRVVDEETTAVSETWAVGPWLPPVIDAVKHWSADGLTGPDIQRRNLSVTLENLKQRMEIDDRR